MRRTTSRALAATALLLLLAGCGGESAPSASTKPSPVPSRSPGATGCADQLRLTSADAGKTVCLERGGELRLTLDGTKSRPWEPVKASGHALTAINAGIVLQPGDATAAYRAAATGTVHLTSSRPLCAQPSSPGGVSCKGIQEFLVTVRIG
ncbi:hypothetical protein [Streptomyces sp. LaPpAH-108]|uniref:hypothetical protein n=1 Tax=Streptomyces sp. LaPpAH-108 TaxID=1155714 RepID=UPI00036D0153|nr:hypothetical protein [Streptomyces sp. LaPpAH-108]